MTAKALRAEGAAARPRTVDPEALRRAMASSEAGRAEARRGVEATLSEVLVEGRTPVEVMVADPCRRPPGMRRLEPPEVPAAYAALDLEGRLCAVAELIGRDGATDARTARIREAYDHLRRYGTFGTLAETAAAKAPGKA